MRRRSVFRRRKAPPPPIYRAEECEGLRVAARFNASLLDLVRPHMKPGTTTGELDSLVHEYTLEHGHTPACLGYQDYPRTICTSVNNVVCHGIPNDTPLKDGDIVNVDATTIVDGWHGDCSETFLIGQVDPAARKLVQVAFDAMWTGIHAVKPYGRVIDVGRAIHQFAHPRGYGVVREYQGHGIGREFHQEPGVPHFPESRIGRDVIKPGMCFTVEPMINQGRWETVQDKRDGWTVRTIDGKLSAQFEHQLLIGEDGPEVLTLTRHGPQEGHRF